jgi:hypothetical protein
MLAGLVRTLLVVPSLYLLMVRDGSEEAEGDNHTGDDAYIDPQSK